VVLSGLFLSVLIKLQFCIEMFLSISECLFTVYTGILNAIVLVLLAESTHTHCIEKTS